jgi:hypothetical protein
MTYTWDEQFGYGDSAFYWLAAAFGLKRSA